MTAATIAILRWRIATIYIVANFAKHNEYLNRQTVLPIVESTITRVHKIVCIYFLRCYYSICILNLNTSHCWFMKCSNFVHTCKMISTLRILTATSNINRRTSNEIIVNVSANVASLFLFFLFTCSLSSDLWYKVEMTLKSFL